MTNNQYNKSNNVKKLEEERLAAQNAVKNQGAFKTSDAYNNINNQKTAAENAVNNQGAFQASKEYNAMNANKAKADNAIQNYGDFSYSNQSSVDDIMNKILNREKFSYDVNADALYQQYKDKYIQQGKMAMQDTMGQAAAMTGGYGNSYSAMVGNQAYQSSLNQLNDVIPELYQMAYDKYNQEGQNLYNQYGMLVDDRNSQYSMWGDKYNRLQGERSYYSNEAANQWNRDYGVYQDEYGRLVDNRNYYTNAENNQWNRDYGVYQDEYGRLVNNRDYATNEYNNLYNQEYNEFINDRNYNAEESWKQKEFDFATQQYKDSQDWKQKEFDFTNQQYQDSQDRYDKEWQREEDRYQDSQDRYDKEWQREEDRYQDSQDRYDKEWEYNTSQDTKDNARQDAYGMLQMGIMPSEEVLAAAGISNADATAIIDQYNANDAYEKGQVNQSNARQDAYGMLQMGVMPSADVLAAAGISQADADAIIKKYNDNEASDNYWRQMEYDYDTGVRNESNARQDAYAMMQIGLMPSAPMLQAAGISAHDAKLISDRYANAGTGSITGLQPSEYNDVMDSIEGYVSGGDTNGLGSYLNGLVNRGWISEDEAADLWDTYVGGEFEETDTNVDLTTDTNVDLTEEEKKKKKTDGGGFVGNPSRLDRTQGKTYY